ncbi:hypothetical protein N9B72_01620 [Bacteriovoracaceae bacterium]|nr:hypothetical protein [Bacteriovoracaceae bacterium]
MRRIILVLIIFSITFAQSPAYASSAASSDSGGDLLDEVFKDRWKLTRTNRRYLNEGVPIVKSVVTSRGKKKLKKQSMKFNVAAIHTRPCSPVLEKLSIYEKYYEYMSFISKSMYSEKTNTIYFYMESALLPFPMSLKFKIPRISKVGKYPFELTHGIFKNLKGVIEVYNHGRKCLFYTHAHWSGIHTGIPNLIIEMFSETLTRKSFEKLFRISKF